MPTFTYDGLNRDGQAVRGDVVADSSRSAIERLREAGVVVTNINEVQEKKGVKRSGGKVKIGELSLFARQLASMLSAGVPVTRSMITLAKQTENKTLAQTISTIASDVEEGTSLADAFAKYPKIFDKLFVAMIATGEAGGILEQSLVSLSTQLQKQKELQGNIKSALSYPKNIGIFALVLLVGMLVFMVPTFQKMLPDGTPVNGLTKVVFSLSTSIRKKWYMWIIGTLIIIAAGYFIKKLPIIHKTWEKYKLKLPIFGDFITKMVLARFLRTLATLLAGGLTAVDALKSSAPTAGSDLVESAVNKAIDDIEGGKPIAESLDKTRLFPPMVIGMTAIGEEAGNLPEMLDKVAEFYEEDVETMSRSLSALIEPIALIVIGGLVGVMIISMYLPIFAATTSMPSGG